MIHLYLICLKILSFRKHFVTILKEEIRIAKFCTEVFVMPNHWMTKLNIPESSLYMSPLVQSFYPNNIAEFLWYGKVLFILTLGIILSGSKIVKRLRRRQYDPVIIERTIGLVLGPSTALYEPFLKHCTLTNKAVGTIWRALSKPPQEATGSWSLSPLIVSRDSFSHQTWARFQPGGAQPALFGCR